MRKNSIPKVSKEEILKRYEKIKPIVDFYGTKYFIREYSEKEISNLPFIWLNSEDLTKVVDGNIYEQWPEKDFECLHTYIFYACFCPTIAEVLAQIPDDVLNEVSGFEIIAKPKNLEKLKENQERYSSNYHVSIVRLYRKRENSDN